MQVLGFISSRQGWQGSACGVPAVISDSVAGVRIRALPILIMSSPISSFRVQGGGTRAVDS